MDPSKEISSLHAGLWIVVLLLYLDSILKPRAVSLLLQATSLSLSLAFAEEMYVAGIHRIMSQLVKAKTMFVHLLLPKEMGHMECG